MESIGEKLKEAREQKGFSPDQVARDTNIAKRFIRALEDEEFSVFPGETYLLGFLRNYAEYLGLDPDELVTLYHNFKIQEQPVPMEELLDKRRKVPVGLILLVVAIVAALGAGGYFGYQYLANRPQPQQPAAVSRPEVVEPEGEMLVMRNEIIEQRFYEGDVIAVPFADGSFQLTLVEVGEELVLDTPGGNVSLRLAEEESLDLDSDGTPDVKVFLRDIDSVDPTKGVILRLDRVTESPSPTQAAMESPEAVSDAEQPEEDVASSPQAGSPGLASRERQAATILVAGEPEPFSLDVSFRGYCLFRYLVDGERREERYYQRGENLRIPAIDGEVVIWASNAGNASTRVAGRPVDLGGNGAVETWRIEWVLPEGTTEYRLQKGPMY